MILKGRKSKMEIFTWSIWREDIGSQYISDILSRSVKNTESEFILLSCPVLSWYILSPTVGDSKLTPSTKRIYTINLKEMKELKADYMKMRFNRVRHSAVFRVSMKFGNPW